MVTVQTGEFSQQANLDVVSLSISDPIPEPVDPTGGVRATNETGKNVILSKVSYPYMNKFRQRVFVTFERFSVIWAYFEGWNMYQIL